MNEEEMNYQSKEENTPLQTLLKILEEKFDHYSTNKKRVIILIALIIAFICGFGLKGCTSVDYTEYSKINEENKNISKTLYDTKKELDEYKTKIQQYEAQQEADEKAVEKKATPVPTATTTPTPTPTPTPQISNKTTSNTASTDYSGVMSKDYKPKGDEPTWVEIISYCEMQLPDVIGYDADISLYESDTKIIRTGLRYKIETKSLKLKSDKSYHKAIFILQFEDDSYETYRIPTAEVDGIKFR